MSLICAVIIVIVFECSRAASIVSLDVYYAGICAILAAGLIGLRSGREVK